MVVSLAAEKLTLVRGERTLFTDLSFRVRAGEALAVTGANGAGKTSLLRMVAGFITPLAGRLVLRLAKSETDEGEARGRHVGWLGHGDGLKPQLTVAEQLAFLIALYRGSVPGDAVLDEVGLLRQRDFPCRYLSAGQKRRLALAGLVAAGRPLWLLDEPFAALDTAGRALMDQLMRRHCATGGIVIAATHDPLGLDNESLAL